MCSRCAATVLHHRQGLLQNALRLECLPHSTITSARGVHFLTEDVGVLGRSGSGPIMTVTRSILTGGCATSLQPTLTQHGNIGRPCGSMYRDRTQRRNSSRFSRIAAVQRCRGSLQMTRVSYLRRPCQRSASSDGFQVLLPVVLNLAVNNTSSQLIFAFDETCVHFLSTQRSASSQRLSVQGS